MDGKILNISDSQEIIDKISTVFEFLNYKVYHAGSLTSVKTELEKEKDILVVLVCVQQQKQKNAIISYLNDNHSHLSIYFLRDKDKPVATNELPEGVNGTLPLPLTYNDFITVVRRAELNHRTGQDKLCYSTSLTGTSPQIKRVEKLVRHVASTDANVLLQGESGTGKEIVARCIHRLSSRADHPFIAINCGAIPAELLESELFGHEKGAFSGAISSRKGRFELAEGGTLFLDEIGDMPMNMQVKLLRVIQERCFERVGGSRTMSCNVRLIAATHQNLEKHIDEQKFRLDLYYRLNVFPIELAPLRERSEDIPLLIREFVARLEMDKKLPVRFDETAVRALKQHSLPGNVRELENLVERLAILYPGETISHSKLPQRYQLAETAVLEPSVSVRVSSHRDPINRFTETTESSGNIDLKNYLNIMEKRLICQALEESDWVVAKAAKQLSLQRTTLVEKIRKYDISNNT